MSDGDGEAQAHDESDGPSASPPAASGGGGKRTFTCSDCGSSDRPHGGRGLCRRCYQKQQRVSLDEVWDETKSTE